MRILRVAQNLYPEVPGGGSYHVHAMSRDQAAMGHDVTVLTVTHRDDLPRREERDGYTVVRRDPGVTVAGNDISPGVARYLRAESPRFDVIHAHSHLYFSTNLAALTRRLGGPPLAITNHGLYSQRAPRWAVAAYLRTVGRWTFDRGDAVFCYTDTDARRLRDLGVGSRIEVVPNGVDTDLFTPEGPTSDRIDHNGATVLFVGRLVAGKRPGDAVAAVSRLPESLNAKLYVVGDGPLRTELEAVADDAAFLGTVPYEEMPELYRASDVLVLPSQAEGFPRAVIEAFATEVPAVTSRLDQIEPVISEGGLTVDIGDIDGYVDALGRVLRADDPAAGARKLVLDRFRWTRTVEETTAVLDQLG